MITVRHKAVDHIGRFDIRMDFEYSRDHKTIAVQALREVIERLGKDLEVDLGLDVGANEA